jgi:membrane protease YdiL (CAAX protease family)
LVVFTPVLLVSNTPAFLKQYPFYKQASQSLGHFILWELSYGFQFFCLEFFFRGFILFALVRYLGHAAIFVMTIPYTMIHFAKPLPETLGAILAGIALGTLALRTRSIYGGVLIHIAVAWSMDLLVLFHKGELRELLSGF